MANKTKKNKVEFGKIISLKDSWKMPIVCDKDCKVSGKLKIKEGQEPNLNDEEVLIREALELTARPIAKGLHLPQALQKS